MQCVANKGPGSSIFSNVGLVTGPKMSVFVVVIFLWQADFLNYCVPFFVWWYAVLVKISKKSNILTDKLRLNT